MTTQIIFTGGRNPKEWLSEHKGLYHLAGTGAVSRYEWARAICEILNLEVNIAQSTYSNFSSGAERPMYSALDSSRIISAFDLHPVPWKQMLAKTLKESV
jgi:dTDP-4-dehydrorhamnose reductase